MRVFIEDSTYPDRVTHPTGYAEVHRQLILALDTLGVPVAFPECEEALRTCEIIPAAYRDRLLDIGRRPHQDGPDVVHLQVASPHSFVVYPDRMNVALSMTERESLASYPDGRDWVNRSNAMRMVLTPTEWNRDVFERHGIRNVIVVPLGADTDAFRPEPFGFLSMFTGYGYRGSRANWQELVQTFSAEFEGSEDVQLTILSPQPRRPFRYTGSKEAIRLFARDLSDWLRTRRRNVPCVVVRETGDLRQEDILAIIRKHQCYVSYSREGWGFPLLEAMATGLRVVAAATPATRELLDGSPALLFDAGSLSQDNLKFEGGDLATLRRHMRSVYDEARATRRWAARFSWLATATHLREVLRREHTAWLRDRELVG